MMKNSIFYLLMIIIITQVIFLSCKQNKIDSSKKEISVLEDEKWWGGAVLDGRNSPLNDPEFSYDQFADCKANQAAPLFISNKGRYIWSEDPLNIKITKEKIITDARGGEVITGNSGGTLKEAFLYSSRNFFPPSGKTPDPLLFTSPQYNTWIELQYDQNEKDILKYAEDIIKNGFPVGVIMIDDNWQNRYGTWKFDCEKFSDPKGMIDKLHSMGFKVMLWVVPFISSDSPVYRELERRKLLIFDNKEKTRPASITWWNGMSALVDLSNPEGEKWFKGQLNQLVTEYGVDGFKLDAGDPESYIDKYSLGDFDPNQHCEAYARLGLDYPLNELRACWKLAGQPLVQRLRDKSHTWSDVQVLIPDMIGLGLIGHQFGCPDMIGGGEWTSFQDTSVLDEELIVRSAQVSALMPMMQFSVAPWRVLGKANLDICKKMANLHYSMGNEILDLARESALSGEPMVRNLEYEYPGKGYEEIKDQFLLGSKIMVAPLAEKGKRSREVVFPEGKWLGDDGVMVTGPVTRTVDVPIERLPWYRKIID
ncbi:MAG TPA: glycoside hydrolase family 31 protein [Bacteroidales bacterium]|nr:glycoside hydrolase family 31 protein [Bacteroidales bacterium]